MKSILLIASLIALTTSKFLDFSFTTDPTRFKHNNDNEVKRPPRVKIHDNFEVKTEYYNIDSHG